MMILKRSSFLITMFLIVTSVFGKSEEIANNYDDLCPPVQEEHKCCDPCEEISKNKLYDQGHEICPDVLPKAYNAPARINICNGWDTYVTASYILWEVLGDQLNIGVILDRRNVPYTFDIEKFNFNYESGFKIGLGQHFDRDNWDLYAEYTRLHGKISRSLNIPFDPLVIFETPWLPLRTEIVSLKATQGNQISGPIRASWKMDLDKIDLELGRYYYVGTHLLFRTHTGATVHWLDQNYKIDFTLIPAPDFGYNYQDIKTDSWALGPRIGIDLKWMISKGFRCFLDAALDLTFASNKTSGITQTDFFVIDSYVLLQSKDYIIRDVEQLRLGLGWGKYFDFDKSHVDISVAYEAQRYSHTNYMSQYIPNIDPDYPIQTKPGDLFLHGLTLSARIDF